MDNIGAFLNQINLDDDILRDYKVQNKANVLNEIARYRQRYKHLDNVYLDYLTPAQQAPVRHNLRRLALLLRVQMRYEKERQKTENIQGYLSELIRCEDYLDRLDPQWREIIKKEPARACLVPERPGVYQVFSLSKWLVEHSSYAISKSKSLLGLLGAVNEKRLYWIWSSLFIKGVLEKIPSQFFNVQQANKAVAFPDKFTPYLSWGLYYFRFSINFYLSVKHAFHPYMTEEEKKDSTPWGRFASQLELRKFILLNDFFWATANILCCFLLVGPKFGVYGDALTIVLLLFDISMAVWAFVEEETEFNKDIQQLNQEIDAFLKRKDELESKQRIAAEDDEFNRLEADLAAFQEELAQKQLSWTVKKLKLINDIVYAVGLTLTFVVLTTPFMPLSVATVLSVNFVGAVLCLALTVVCNAIHGGLNIYEAHSSVKYLQQKQEQLVGKFRDSLGSFPIDSVLNRQMYLDILNLQKDTKAGQQQVSYLQAKLVRSFLIESLVPAVIFASFVFLPMGVGAAALGAALGLAIASYYLIERLNPNNKGQSCREAFPEADYQTYVANTLAAPSDSVSMHSSFGSNSVGFFSTANSVSDRDSVFVEPDAP